MKPIIATACDTRFFSLLNDLIASLKFIGLDESIDLGVVDLGLSEEQVAVLENQKIIVRKPLFIDVPKNIVLKQADKGLLVRPRYPDIFPDNDPIMHIDSDVWVQSIVHLRIYIDIATQTGRLTITPQTDRAYQNNDHLIGWRYLRFEQYFGSDKASRFMMEPNYLNAGIFCAPRNSPFWQKWRTTFEQSLSRTTRNIICDQTVINFLAMTGNIKTYPLPSTCNWLLHLATPALSPKDQTLVTPLFPHEKIGLLHLTGSKKFKTIPVIVLGKGSVELNLQRTALLNYHDIN